ncbi:hypothetical protein ACFO4L_09290 [Bacillus daqingensis]|uniref:Uncharacterized protein n=1 Tax=Bacillus daqingensis TaxID=872396 RepID=A0ABV9NV52_9BACI
MLSARQEFARRRWLDSVPEPLRSVYEYVYQRELQLADAAESESDLLEAARRNPPVLEASEKFNLDPMHVYTLVQKLDAEYIETAPSIEEAVQVIDYTDVYKKSGGARERYLLIQSQR